MMLASSIPFLTVLALLPPTVLADTYNLVKEYSGPTFFDDWIYYNNFDNLTNGDAIFVSQAEGVSQGLTVVDPTTNHAIIKVDNTTNVVFNLKRNTVRITTSDLYSVGSVWTADMFHVPYGCSVWPAWWSQAPAWPVGGEIDTFEGVNLQTNNRISLHTLPGCTQAGQIQSSNLILANDCSNLTNSNEGCVTEDPNPASFGAPFAQAGGGVFVTEYAETGINVWFFSRANVPSVLASNSSEIDTSTFGLPVANYPATDCNSQEFFSAQQLILDITLCGDFAGNAEIFNQTCSGICYNDFVVGNGSNYATAFFEIASIRVFSKTGTNTIVSPSGSSSSPSSSGSSGSGSSSGSTGSGGTAAGSHTGSSSALPAMTISLAVTGFASFISLWLWLGA